MNNQANFEYDLQKIYKRQKEAARDLRNFILQKIGKARKTRVKTAELAGKTRQTLQKLIAAKTTTPKIDTLTGLEWALKLEPGTLVRFIYSASIAGDVSSARASPSLHLPNSFPHELRETSLLKDHIGLWCAICLAYLEPNEIGDYYPYGEIPSIDDPWLQIAVERVFGWTVPIHCYGCPSEGVVLDATTAGSCLNSLLLCQDWELENLANSTFYRGNLNLNMAIRLALSCRYHNKGNEEEEAVQLAKATISNGGSSQSEVVGPLLDSHMPPVLNDLPYQKLRVLLALGNRYRNIGRPDVAEKEYYGQARYILSNMLPEKAKKARHALERRELSVRQRCASLDEAKGLIKDAEDDEQYGVRTTRNYIAWDNFRKYKYLKAHNEFDTILHDNSLGKIVSWWHKMAGCLGLGVTMYTNDRVKYDEALGYCLKAEYISAMLGLQVDVTRGISRQLLGHHTLLSPSAVVKKIGRERGVSPEKMVEIRCTALIESGLQEELLAELSGASLA